ncbi:hypothetical protein APHAL10511_008569 [Amanita phalloides]|nr:hypothetical protein APHAL10511_008569 [Amanita phalloides]
MPLIHSTVFCQISRVATPNYEPTDDDILRAPLPTVGVPVQEYRLPVASNGSRDWLFYDVGGARTVLAPVPRFNAEDVKVNRLEDSLLPWSAVCKSKLLERATLILFLNKYDILKQKLKSGIYTARHVNARLSL